MTTAQTPAVARDPSAGRNTIDWKLLTALLEDDEIEWLQKGKPYMADDNKVYCLFVPYVKAQSVRLRLDTIVPGRWNYKCAVIPHTPGQPTPDGDQFSMIGTLSIMADYGLVIRESVGSGTDYKSAETDAFKRAAQRLGIGNELYSIGNITCQLEGMQKGAKPVIDPKLVYLQQTNPEAYAAVAPAAPVKPAPAPAKVQPALTPPGTPTGDTAATCPICAGAMWDNRATKTKPTQPDYKCKDKGCTGVIWPPRPKPAAPAAPPAPAPAVSAPPARPIAEIVKEDDDLPF